MNLRAGASAPCTPVSRTATISRSLRNCGGGQDAEVALRDAEAAKSAWAVFRELVRAVQNSIRRGRSVLATVPAPLCCCRERELT